MQTKRECHLASYEEYSQRANIEIKETKHCLYTILMIIKDVSQKYKWTFYSVDFDYLIKNMDIVVQGNSNQKS